METELTLNKIIYNIRTLIKDRHADDFNFTDRNIEFWLIYLREKLISQSITKNRPITDNLKQTIYNLSIEDIDKGKDSKIDTGFSTKRTEIKIPSSIATSRGNLITGVYGLTGDSPVAIQPKARAIRNRHNKYASKFPVVYFDRGYIYIQGCSAVVTNISVEGVFRNPVEVDRLNGLSDEEILNKEYPINAKDLDTIHTIIKRQELDLFYQLEDDKINDAQTIY